MGKGEFPNGPTTHQRAGWPKFRSLSERGANGRPRLKNGREDGYCLQVRVSVRQAHQGLSLPSANRLIRLVHCSLDSISQSRLNDECYSYR
jgi:hypothetical protein